MFNYIKADLIRIFQRIPRWIIIAILFWLGSDMFHSMTEGTDVVYTMDECINLLEYIFKYFPLVIGVVELNYVVGEDFKTRTMQVVIGRGLSKRRVLSSKLIEFSLIMLFDTAVFSTIIVLITSIELDIGLLSIMAGMCVVRAIAMMSITFIFAFLTQSIFVPLIVYILTCSTILNSIIKALEGLIKIPGFFPHKFTLTYFIEFFQTRLEIGRFYFPAFIGILIYFAIGYVLSLIIFNKKELEF